MERHIFVRYLLKLLNFNLTHSDFIQGFNSMETNSGYFKKEAATGGVL